MSRKFKKKEAFKFKSGFNIGTAAAEQDPLLDSCLISTSYYAAVKDMNDPRCCVIGRSGSGKTAIIERLTAENDHRIPIKPEKLAFQFLVGSEMVRALRDSDVSLDLFYKLLWRHTCVVEILKHYFPEQTRRVGKLAEVIESIKKNMKLDKERERALNYLDQWGATLLQIPEQRIREIHDTLEKNLQFKLGVQGGWPAAFGLESNVNGEVISRGGCKSLS